MCTMRVGTYVPYTRLCVWFHWNVWCILLVFWIFFFLRFCVFYRRRYKYLFNGFVDDKRKILRGKYRQTTSSTARHDQFECDAANDLNRKISLKATMRVYASEYIGRDRTSPFVTNRDRRRCCGGVNWARLYDAT